jgi:molybdopterin-guanine dinucleotide biosynthesis protein A
MVQLTGILIAGGKSERMEMDKSWLFYQGKTFAEQAIKQLELLCQEVLISSNLPDWPNKYRIVADIHTNIGPIGGLHACLRATATEYNLVSPCDLPLMTVETLNKLLTDVSSWQAVIFRHDGYVEPLCGVYATSCLPVVEQQIAAGQYSMQKLLAKLNVHYIEADAETRLQLRNINTPADYATLEGFQR